MAVPSTLGCRVDLAAKAFNVRKSFDGKPVLKGVTLDIRAGEFVAMIGASGSGKSTFLRALAGLDGDFEGDLLIERHRSIVFQKPRLLPWMKVRENVVFGLQRNAAILRKADDVLGEVNLRHRSEAWPLTLSGGEAQRAALARALLRDPKLLLLDEPFGALDALTRIKVHRLVSELHAKRQPAVLLVTHDVDEAIALANRIVVLADGVIAFDVLIDHSQRDVDSHKLKLRADLLSRLGL